MKKARRLVALVFIVLASVALARLSGDVLGGLTGVRSFEDFTLDLRQQTTPESFQEGRGERESEIVLVLFDELTFQETTWLSPFPRTHLAELVDAVAGAGARTIGVDVYLDRRYPMLNEMTGGEDLLRDAIERAENVILVSPVQRTDSGFVTAPPHPFFAEVAHDVGTAELPSSFESFRDGTLAVRSGRGLEPSFALAMYAHARGLDVDSLLDAAWERGRIDLPGLPDGVGEIPEEWKEIPEDWRSERGASSGAEASSDPGRTSEPGEASAPVEVSESAEPSGARRTSREAIVPFRILYHGPPSGTLDTDPPGTFTALGSSTAPLLASLDPAVFRDKIVILGTGFHAEDRFRTPFYGYSVRDDRGDVDEYDWMYGVEIHANALQNIIDGRYVRPMGGGSKLALMLLLAAFVGGVVFRRGTGWGAVATVLAVLGVWTLAFWAWAGVVYVPGAELMELGPVGAWVPIGTPVLGTLLSYVGSVAYVAIVEGREKRFIKGAFGKYLSPDVVAEISEDPSTLELGGEKRPLTLLFSDLSGFTSISEDMDAEDLISLLNEYLNDMTEVVFEEKGYLDKYIGDAIMAFWNAPKDVPDHPDRAMRTAILMQRRMTALNERWRQEKGDREPLEVRIGIHTGEVVVGNVGGEDRFDYSAIGDAVNLAARLEPANKTYDTLNMVSEDTLRMAARRYRVRELDYIAVKGKDEPVKVYELLEMEGEELDPAKEEAIRHYDVGIATYRRREWAEAKRHFEAAVRACPDDGPSRLYVERCVENIADPPPPDWDFVVRRTEK